VGESNIITLNEFDQDKFDRSKRLEWLDFDAVRNSKVLLAGAGAIGNETAKNLVLSGYQNLTIIDIDHVARSNLNRCLFFTEQDVTKKRFKAEVVAEKVKFMDPGINVTYLTDRVEDLSEKLIRSHGLVLGCLDNIESRLHLNAHCYFNRIPYVDGATRGLVGKVQVIIPPRTSCFECNMNKTHMDILAQRFGCTDEKVTHFEPRLAAEITTTSVVSAIQVRESIKITSRMTDRILHNLFYYDGLRNLSEELEIEINPECPHH